MDVAKSITADIITRFKNGDELSFQKIYDSYSANVYRFAFSFLKNRTHSEEIVQDAFILLWENRDRFDETKPMEPYLFTITKRLVLDSLRKQTSTHKLRAQLMHRISEITNETENKIIYTDLMNFTENAVQQLPKQQQVVFRLSRYEGLSLGEIGERLDLSENTVKNHLVIALKKMRTKLLSKEVIYLLCIFSNLS